MSVNHQVSRRMIPNPFPGAEQRCQRRDHAARERLAERPRIGLELHETLFRGFLAAPMQMQRAVSWRPEDSGTKPRFGGIAALMDRVLGERRRAVRGPRSTREAEDLSLAQALAAVPGELSVSPLVQFRVLVMGESARLNPSHWEDVYRICRESIVNACRHSGGNEIEAELVYRHSGLRITIRDNGCGIDAEDLRQDSRWGLQGMRDRAERIGARLRILTSSGRGTEVELFLPAIASAGRRV